MNKDITLRKGPTAREENDGIYRFSWETCRERVCTTSIWIKEPSFFEIAKLMETGLVNLNRVEVLWCPVTNHLLEVIIHPLNHLREWGIDVITTLVRSAIQYEYSTPLKENQGLQTSGDIISFGWPLFLNIIGAINNSQGKNSVRSTFQCLQLVVTDYLPVLPWNCLPLAVETTGKFGSQTQDLNVSLTAIGLMVI
ncbi:hypothetical protein OUZ56_012518 [Daphnia magna]|uniref:MON2 protein n=1 Tax=Daphnia magna TaxID=35525 RepID=A0ABQ9Z397_9CRUS|nr:hypothetical protein OUZ56_012518 [Daphnia magna]